MGRTYNYSVDKGAACTCCDRTVEMMGSGFSFMGEATASSCYLVEISEPHSYDDDLLVGNENGVMLEVPELRVVLCGEAHPGKPTGCMNHWGGHGRGPGEAADVFMHTKRMARKYGV